MRLASVPFQRWIDYRMADIENLAKAENQKVLLTLQGHPIRVYINQILILQFAVLDTVMPNGNTTLVALKNKKRIEIPVDENILVEISQIGIEEGNMSKN